MSKATPWSLALAAACILMMPAAAIAQTPASNPQPGNPAALQQARTIVEAITPTAQRPQVVRGMINAIIAPIRGQLLATLNDPGIQQIIDAHLGRMAQRLQPVTEQHIPDLLEATAQAYAREFSPAELDQIAAFAKTPAGARYMSRSSAVLGDPAITAANRAFLAEAAIANRSIETEMRTAITDYLAKHPEVAQKLQAQARARQQAAQPQPTPAKRP